MSFTGVTHQRAILRHTSTPEAVQNIAGSKQGRKRRKVEME